MEGAATDGFGRLSDGGTFRIERLLPGPIERVWAYLVEPVKRAEWLAGGDFELKPGGLAEFIFDHRRITPAGDKPPKKYEGFCGEVRLSGKILVAKPPRLLSFEWPEMSGEISEVLIELTPKNSRVLLTLTHSRLVTRDDLLSTSAGWHTHLDILAAKLAGRTPEPFWAAHTRHEGEYQKRIPA